MRRALSFFALPVVVVVGLLVMACVSLLAIFPAGRLPASRPGEIPAHPPVPAAGATVAAIREDEEAAI